MLISKVHRSPAENPSKIYSLRKTTPYWEGDSIMRGVQDKRIKRQGEKRGGKEATLWERILKNKTQTKQGGGGIEEGEEKKRVDEEKDIITLVRSKMIEN